MKSILKLPLAGCLRIAANVQGFAMAGLRITNVQNMQKSTIELQMLSEALQPCLHKTPVMRSLY